jgi:23S rRNA (cytosine1962-C5)-methyltransferase
LFLDQRDNRQRVRTVATGQSVLNLFAYTGSFSVAALAGGASAVTSVDLSRTALEWAARNAARIGAGERHRVIADDAFDVLARMHARGERFDLVIVDPPSYSTSKRGRFQVTKDYSDLCRAALLVLNDGGTLVGCLNHHGVSQVMLRRFVQEAAGLAGVFIEQLRDVGPQRDFPCRVGDEPSMKSVWCRVRHRADSQAPLPGHRPGASTRPVRRRPR